MNNNYVEIKIKIDKQDYDMLENIAVDMPPAVYLQKFLKTRLFKNNSIEHNNNKEKEKFKKLKEDLSRYNIKQADIAEYFKVSQASVSIFLKKETKKSHLYPKFFTHSTASGLLYSIYCNKYLLEYMQYFSANEQEYIGNIFYNLHKKIREENIFSAHEDDQKHMFEKAEKEDFYFEKDSHTKKIYRNNMLIIASILSIRIIHKVPAFNLNEFIEVVGEFKKIIIDIDHNNLNNKDLDYLDSKISYVENKILPIIMF